MTTKGKRSKLKNNGKGKRKTPRDLEVEGTFAQRPPAPPEPPRDPTPAEVRADNVSATEYGMMVFAMRNWVPIFKDELAAMNRGKVGRPYDFSDSLVVWIGRVMAMTGMTFRAAAGLAKSIMSIFGMASPSPSRLQERASAIAERFLAADAEQDRGVFATVVCGNVSSRTRRVGIDSTGINLSDTSLWRMRKWKTGPKDKGWLKLHALADVDSGEIIAYAVTSERVGDSPMLRTLVDAAVARGHRFGTVYADGAYASNDNWIFLCRENRYRFVTSFTTATAPTKNGCEARGEAARLWCSLPYDEWKRVSGYGTRWKLECVFSDLKRIFGETVDARTVRGIVREMVSRIDAFNDYKGLRAGIMKVTGNGVALV